MRLIIIRIALLCNFVLPLALQAAMISSKTIDLGVNLSPAIEAWRHLNMLRDEQREDSDGNTFKHWNRNYTRFLHFTDLHCKAMDALQPGDRIQFSDGKQYSLKRFLGAGHVVFVWQTSADTALRIPRCGGLKFAEVLKYMRLFNEGYLKLIEHTSSVIRVHSNFDSLEYAEVELIEDFLNENPILFTELLERLDRFPALTEYKSYPVSQLLSALVPLNKDFFRVARLGDGLQCCGTVKIGY